MTMIRNDGAIDDANPTATIVANSPSLQQQVITEMVQRDFPAYNCGAFTLVFVAMIAEWPLEQRARLFQKEDGLKASIRDFRPHGSADANTLTRYRANDHLIWAQSYEWSEVISPDQQRVYFVNSESGQEMEVGVMFDNIHDSHTISFNDIHLLPNSAHREAMKKKFVYIIQSYLEKRDKHLKRRPRMPWAQTKFLKHVLNADGECAKFHPISEQIFGSFEWYLNCIWDELARAKRAGDLMNWPPIAHHGLFHIENVHAYRRVAVEAAFECLSDEVKGTHNLEYYVEKYSYLL